jgi:hypothetical protein
MPQKGALATKRQKSCVCGLWLYCVCGGYGSGPSGSELDSDDGSGVDDSDSDLDPRSSDGSSKRLKPTHPQPTEVSECLCPASHRREYYSDDLCRRRRLLSNLLQRGQRGTGSSPSLRCAADSLCPALPPALQR